MKENFLHYRGLPAEIYDRWHGGGTLGDEGFYLRWIEEAGGPALEGACGTGRLLIPYLKAGLDVEGLDASPDMLAICRRNAEREGVDPVLHETLMQEMDLGKRYRTIYVPFRSFMVLTDREVVFEVLSRFRGHLEDGGQLLISLFVPSYSYTAEQQGQWHLRKRVELEEKGDYVLIHDSVTNRLVEQVKTVRFRYEVYRGDVLERTEMQEFRMRWYFKYEFAMMLEKAGFKDVFPFGDFTGREVSEGDGEMTFRGVR